MAQAKKRATHGTPRSAAELAKALGGRKAGSGWMASCPAHDDRKPSLSICEAKDGRLLVRCHGGCEQERVISALRSRGLWLESSHQVKRFTWNAISSRETKHEEGKRTEVALSIWMASRPTKGTAVETYLTGRGLTIRFHAGLKHPSGGIWPAMVALVTRGVDEAPLAIHRTFLAHDGRGKAPFDPQKMMLGPCRGGAVRLAPAGDVLMVGEGIETSLAAMQARGFPAWAALSTSGLLALDLPPDVREVIVLADGDDAGKAAARGAALRWKREGRRVRIANAPEGLDFNDVLLGRARPMQRGSND